MRKLIIDRIQYLLHTPKDDSRWERYWYDEHYKYVGILTKKEKATGKFTHIYDIDFNKLSDLQVGDFF